MPARDAAATIGAAIESVLAGRFADWELLITDDASTDHTVAQAERAAGTDRRVRIASRAQPGGPAVARNDAIERASGRYLAFLDADDLWLPDKLRAQREFAARRPAPLTHTGYWRSGRGFAGALAQFEPVGQPVRPAPELTYARLERGNAIGCLTAMVDRELAGDVRLPNIPGAEDFGLWLAILRGGGLALGLDRPLAVYRTGRAGSVSADRRGVARAVWRLMRQVEGHSRLRSARNLGTQIARAVWP
jgi:glycosyltransferase involved in cell wall biosynthesis